MNNPRMTFGFGILLAVIVLAIVIAIGNVKQETSHGLDIVLGSLATMSGAFAQ